ncbi:hypothetical protein FBU30_002319 [Linnemannia zychae]|nr:hypothetical protein FBU30_002319 [Linnemannia zychae]
MPATMPPKILIRRAFDKVSNGIQFFLRGILVAFIWLVILPYFTIWIWRLYFWIGETFAFRANGLETPVWNSTTFFSSRHNLTVASESSSVNDKALNGISFLLFQYIAPEHQWISKFILDCFEGQIISSVVVVVFVVIFLLREWVIQNQEAEVIRPPMDDAAVPLPGAGENAAGFNVENAVEHLIAAHHHIEAVVEGEATSSDSSDSSDDADSDTDRTRIFSRPATSSPTDSVRPMRFSDISSVDMDQFTPSIQEPRPPYFWEIDNAGEGSSSGSTTLPPNATTSLNQSPSTLPIIRPSAERTLSADPTTGIYVSANTPDKSGRRPSALGSRSAQGVSFRAPEDLPTLEDIINHPPPRVGYVYDASQQTFHPDTRWIPAPSTSQEASTSNTAPPLNIDDAYRANGMRRPWPTHNLGDDNPNLQGANRRRIYSRDGTPLYWKSGVPLTYGNIYLNTNGTEMSYDEKVAKYHELCETADIAIAEAIPSRWRPKDGPQLQQPLEEIPEALDALARQRQEMVRHINERGIRLRRGAPVPAPDPIIRNRAAPAVRPQNPPQPPPRVPPAVPRANQNDQMDDVNVDLNEDELDGILEVIGMHGSYWILLQNSLLMSALMCASLGIGVWIPFMIGKTTLLMNPFNILRMPLDLLSRLTDPILDYMIDHILPFIGTIISKMWSTLSYVVTPILTPIVESSFGTLALEPLNTLYDDHIVPLWKAFVNSMITVGGVMPDMHSSNSSIENASQIINQEAITPNSTAIFQIARTWTELAYGSSPGDKFAAVAIGYFILFGLAFWYFIKTEHVYGETVAKAIRDAIRQQGLILRIAFFVAMEMLVFPLFCGIIIGLSTLPLFQGATVATRIAFYRTSPNWFLLMHWLVGTAFMFNFSLFVSICRTVTRPGVMWFIRDPNDQGFHPIREILERPFLWQLRKLGSGALTYMTLIILGITLTTQFVKITMKGVLPLRWPVDEPISDLPVDLLLFHLVVPLTFRWLDPTNRAKLLFTAWWRQLARWLRLSSFMYATENQRFYEEEGHVEYRTWKAWLLRSRPSIPNSEQEENIDIEDNAELEDNAPAVFVRDGGWYRVPNTDRITQLKDRRILVPVDENGNALDPNDDLPGEVDPLTDNLPRNRDNPNPRVDPKDGTIIVYGPPNFKRRLIAFIILLWTSVMTFLVLSVITPTFGVLMPFTLGLIIELFIVLPLRNAIDEDANVIFMVDWAVGLIYMKIIHRILTVLPNNRFAIDMNRVFIGTDINRWDAGLATRRIILPVFAMCALAVAGPFIGAWVATEALGLTGAARYRVFRQAYPIVMMIGLVIFGLWECTAVIRGWSQYVRDQEYLVGRQLHNLREEDTPADAVPTAEAIAEPEIMGANDEMADQEIDIVGDGEPTLSSSSNNISTREQVYIARSSIDLDEGSKKLSDTEYTPLLRSSSRLVVDPELDLGSDWDDEGSASRTRPRRSLRLQAQRQNDSYYEI